MTLPNPGRLPGDLVLDAERLYTMPVLVAECVQAFDPASGESAVVISGSVRMSAIALCEKAATMDQTNARRCRSLGHSADGDGFRHGSCVVTWCMTRRVCGV